MFTQIRRQYQPILKTRRGEKVAGVPQQVLVCTGTGCSSSGSWNLLEELQKELVSAGLEEEYQALPTGCLGFCQMGPVLVVYPEGIFYCQVQKKDVREIVQEHFRRGRVVERLLYTNPATGNKARTMEEIAFFQPQLRRVLANCGRINPESLEEYLGFGGFAALEKALQEGQPEKIIAEIKASGLRGRGGGGFPTGKKWEMAAQASGSEKYLICNADEGDPGAFMDRSLLEGDPFRVVEAMLLAGYAIGAETGFIYIRSEYPVAVRRLEKALSQCRQKGLLGANILGSGFNFELSLKLGAGAFVCGEETALLHSAEGKRGEPRPRPPYPAQAGFEGCPTVINNVETLANVPEIILKGAKWFSEVGSENSKGTKIFSLAGKIACTGLIEVPLGITLREIIFKIGGGIPHNRQFKAAQTGGPSGGVIPAKHLDTPMDYESLKAIGSIMGSGGLIILDETDCMVDLAKFYLQFSQEESCGRCTPCRVGSKVLLDSLNRITQGQGGDLAEIEALAEHIRQTSLCGLGQTAPNPVLSTLNYFRKEYEEHLYTKQCRAGVCQKLTAFRIDPEKCIACGQCFRNCPEQAISPENDKYTLDPEKCQKCGLCQANCPVEAISGSRPWQ